MKNPFLEAYINAVNPKIVDVIIQVPTEELTTLTNFLKANNITFPEPIVTGKYAFVQAQVPQILIDQIEEKIPGVIVHINVPKKAAVHINLSIHDGNSAKLPPYYLDQALPLPINPFRFNPQILFQPRQNIYYLPNTFNSVFGPVQYKFMDEIYPLIVDKKTDADGTGVKVAVIDTGYTPVEPQGLNRKGGLPDLIVLSSLEPIPADLNGHSSWCINTLGGGLWTYYPFGPGAGIAPGCSITAIKVLTAYGSGTTFDVIKGMQYAAKVLNADVVSMSLGGPIQGSVDTDPAVLALEDLTEHSKSVFVVASGDSGEYGKLSTMDSPAVAPHAISVASISMTDENLNTSPETYNVAYWSSAGGPEYPWAPVCAAYGGGRAKPGLTPDELIYNGLSPWSLLDGLYSGIKGFGQEGLHGTSQSCPMVAGLIALLIQENLIKGETGKERAENFVSKLQSKYSHNYFSGYGVPKYSDFL